MQRHRKTPPYPNYKNKQRQQRSRQCVEIWVRTISLIYMTYLFHSTFSLLIVYLIFPLPSVFSHPKFPQQQFCKNSFSCFYFPSYPVLFNYAASSILPVWNRKFIVILCNILPYRLSLFITPIYIFLPQERKNLTLCKRKLYSARTLTAVRYSVKNLSQH